MIIEMKHQEPPNLIDLSCNWEPDAEYDGFFQKGARSKSIYHSPDSCDEGYIIPRFRYLFKESIDRHRVQYWSEIVAYRISPYFHINVPPSFAATKIDNDNGEQICGALIEWFYDTNSPSFIEYKEGGDFLSDIMPEFDRKTGRHHNIIDNLSILKSLFTHEKFISKPSWISEFISMFLFDIVIGNTDRHQDNFGLIIEKHEKNKLKISLSPAYDNGTSLGYEILESKLNEFRNPSRRLSYISRGTHHMRDSLEGSRYGHFEFIKELIIKAPGIESFLIQFFDIDISKLESNIMELTEFIAPVPLTQERAEFMLSLVQDRIAHAIRTIKEHA